MFNDKKIKISCPNCTYVSAQNKRNMHENITIICPKCGYYFLPNNKHK
ncbi:YnfU family zinc-binding protein [Moellerella wisconsensis]|uniref:Uncharacterized protein n=4 Tax=Moellerella wisconsensis TaxID=158849 RepID=A0A0N0ZAE6_9GAMM|nr:YnfU family zinc-binding protein [Moellerella wisconsensis]KPD02408.1 hypothetical protein M992_2120 [Moellerella wisconsensis ATCC 35017]UNH25667.1 YnfU family zinc-binding protein [Moellerella wisconsensis]UNH28807.1 YnfU family zinc-binding protein [Moellerella wisconsensis]UNH32266.1 YnfU family zinc-binding protein [Moellerella wisconsensis]UNH40437.1 YnfU family zinc-binding protein [Moellerella wisconsensis]